MDLALNNLQRLICHKTQSTNQPTNLIFARQPDKVIVKKKWTCQIVDCAISAEHRRKLKESEKWHKYLYFDRKLKKLWKMRVTVIPIVIGTLSTATKGLAHELEDLEDE